MSSSSDRSVAASQANGALSSGPVTAEGKRRSSRNAEKHGIYTAALLLNNESHELFDELRNHYLASYEPEGKIEEYLVDDLVACHWRKNRLAAIEAATIDHQLDLEAPAIDESFESIDSSTRTALALRALDGKTRILDTCGRRESALARQFDRLLTRLASLQAARKKTTRTNLIPKPNSE